MFYKQLFFLLCVVLCKAGDQFEDDCGLEAVDSTPLVRGGLGGVKSNQFPWHVAIFRREEDNQFEQICGGSLVRSNVVISAAHCFSILAHSHQVHVEDYRVLAGVRLSSWNSTEFGRQRSEVRKVSLGEEYGASYRNFQHDISVIHLMTRFTFSDMVRAVCLDLTDFDLYTKQTSPGSLGKVAGWGITEWGTIPDSLNFLGVPVVAGGECFDKLPLGSQKFFTADKICAGLTNGTAVCQGDSGGGLVFPQNTSAGPQRWFLRGVLSNAPTSLNLSDPCVSNFAFYTNIYRHRIWLTSQMDDNLPQDGCSVREFPGVCRELSDCPTALEEIASGISPQLCSPYGSKICCEVIEDCPPLPSPTFRLANSKAQEYCLELPEKLYPCQQNGSNWSREDLCGPEPEKHKPGYLVRPLTSPSEIRRYGFMSGELGLTVFLVSERWLLTRASSWDLLLEEPAEDITPAPEVVFSIRRAVRHPQYFPGNSTNSMAPTDDIVLLEMDRPVPFSRSYRPVCLHTDSVAVGALTRRDWRGNRAATPLSQEKCGREFPPGSETRPGGVTESHLCATSNSSKEDCGIASYLTTNNGHRVACTQLLVGVSLDDKNNGSICTNLYLRLSPYIPWVESVVWP